MAKKEVQLIDGKKIAGGILLDLKLKIAKIKIRPGLAAILIGDDPASKLYVKNKEKACQKIGIDFHTYLCNNNCCKNITEEEALEMIKFLNQDPQIHGILVQLPLPKNFNTEKIIKTIDPKKDADGFHPENLKKFLAGDNSQTPPLVNTILAILGHAPITRGVKKIELKNKKIVVISDSEIFGPAIVRALNDLGGKASQISKIDKSLKEKTAKADILISAVGKPEFIKENFIKNDAIIIDVGITKTDNGFKGDIDFESIKKKASLITPTPGGTGPVTVAMLLNNVYKLAQKN